MVGVLMNFSDIYEIKVFNWKLVKRLIFTSSTNEKIHIKWVCVTKQPIIHNSNQEKCSGNYIFHKYLTEDYIITNPSSSIVYFGQESSVLDAIKSWNIQ